MDRRAQLTATPALFRLGDDRAALFAQPPGLRDLGLPELWERSLERSMRRREAAAARGISLPRSASAKVSLALVAATLTGQAAPMAEAAVTGQAATVQKGARGSGVSALQQALGIASDGVFGRATKSAVRAFQRAHGLTVDGIAGPQTQAALGLAASAGSTTPASTRSVTPASSSTTVALQRALGVAADGIFGPQTRAAVVAYQQAHGLTPDGVAGPATLGALGISGTAIPSTTTAPSTAPTTTGTGTTTPVSATTDASAAPAQAPAPGAGAQGAVSAALSKAGAPYSSGASGPSSFDCSGLTSWAFRQAGISIPRTSFAQYGIGTAVSKDQIQAGDLVFFSTAGAGASDVGIATGPTTAVSATTHGVMSHAIFDSYWGSNYVGARRVG